MGYFFFLRLSLVSCKHCQTSLQIVHILTYVKTTRTAVVLHNLLDLWVYILVNCLQLLLTVICHILHVVIRN